MTVPHQRSLEELLIAYGAGERDAFELFFRRTEHLVYSLIRSKMRNVEKAQEVFQETYFRVHRYVVSFKASEGQALPWLLAIARNSVMDSLKAEKRHAHEVLTEALESPGKRGGWNDQIFFEELLVRLGKEISRDELRLLIDRFVLELSFDDIAQKQGIGQDNARQRVSRLVRKLKASFEP